MAKKVRLEGDWPSPEEIDRELLERIHAGKPPVKDWQPSRNASHAMALVDKMIKERHYDVTIAYDRSILKAWECRLSWKNVAELHAVMKDRQFHRINDPDVSEDYWAEAQTGELAIARAVLNMLDRVTEMDCIREARRREEEEP